MSTARSKDTNPVFAPWKPSRADTFFVARNPVLPFDVFESWGTALDAPAFVARWLAAGPEERIALQPEIENAVERDRARIREKMRALLEKDPRVVEALYVGSPSLVDRLSAWLRDANSEGGQRVEPPLVRYLTRMSSRSMAFGLFAGTTLGRIGAVSDFSAMNGRAFGRKTEIDPWAVYGIVQALAADPNVRRALTYRANPTMFELGGHCRFLATVPKDKFVAFEVGLVERDEYVDAVRVAARAGTVPFATLVHAVEVLGVATDDAESFIHQLIDEQLLVPDLAAPPTCADPTDLTIARLEAIPSTRAIGDALRRVQTGLRELDAAGFGHAPERYRELFVHAKTLPGVEAPDKVFRTALFKSAPEVVLGERVLKDVAQAVDFLRKVATKRGTRDEMLTFVKSFRRRYEGRSVPLLEALDPDVGIGLGDVVAHTPLLDGLPIDPPSDAPSVRWDAWTRVLLDKVIDAAREGSTTVHIAESDVPEGLVEPREMPDVAEIWFRVRRSADPSAREPFEVFLGGLTGPQAAGVASRFAGDAVVRARIERALTIEAERADGIVAEIVHFVRGPGTFALTRRAVRPYEIPCPDAPSVSDEYVILLSDLELRAVGDTVQVFSRRHGKRVFPRLTTAHNIMNSGCAPYQLLAMIAATEARASSLGFSWGPLSDAPFLPRVMFRNVVLKRASWLLGERDIAALRQPKTTTARYLAVQELRARRKLPRHVISTEWDQELIVDLDNPLSVESWIDVLGKKTVCYLEEMLPTPGELVHSDEGRFVSDVYLTAVSDRVETEAARAAPPALSAPAPSSSLSRHLVPGSECLYVKLYAGFDATQDALRQLIAPFVRAKRSEFDRWFFLFYGDPDWHLRVRFFGDAEHLTRELWPAFQRAATATPWNARIHRVELATYDRELERYGGEAGMVASERLFAADSEWALATWELDLAADDVWKVALYGVNRLLEDLGLEGERKFAVVDTSHATFRREFAKVDELDHALSKRFRKDRAQLEALLRGEGPLAEAARVACDVRSEKLASITRSLRAAEADGRLYGRIPDIAMSYVHMSVLRVLPRSNRAHEYALLDFLRRILVSQRARKS